MSDTEYCARVGCSLPSTHQKGGRYFCEEHYNMEYIRIISPDLTEKNMPEPLLKPRSSKLSCTLAEIAIIFIFYEVSGTEEPQHDYLFGGELVTHEETIIYLANKHKVPPMDINITGVLK